MPSKRNILPMVIIGSLGIAASAVILLWSVKIRGHEEFSQNSMKGLVANASKQEGFIQVEPIQSPFTLANPEVSEIVSKKLLLEAFLALLKTYYVDPERVENQYILPLILQTLSEGLQLSYQEEKGHYKVFAAGRELELLSREHPPSDEVIVEQLFALATFLAPQMQGESGSKSRRYHDSLDMVMDALLVSLDAHSSLLSPEAYDDLRQNTEGSFGGLGVLVGMRDQLLTVIKPLPRSPAARQGIQMKDRILAIDDRDTYGYSLADLVDYMRGAPGSAVRLSLLREGDWSVKQVEMRREVIHVDSVASKWIARTYGDLLYLAIDSFTTHTAKEVQNAIEEFQSRHPRDKVYGMILDLRANPGGLLDQAVKVADIFLSQGVIVTTKGRSQEIERASRHGFEDVRSPLVVLIDGESASASEIVAGALRDHDRAVLVGQPSFGKGSVQTIFELPDEKAIKLTIARYYTPLLDSIQNVGIVPHVWAQPIFQLEKNDNLLGEFRYQNEGFLFNHLKTKNRLPASAPLTHGPNRHSFYLRDKKSDFPQVTDKDYELDFATHLFDNLYLSKYQLATLAAQHAKRWLDTSQVAMQPVFLQEEEKAKRFLKERFAIDWQPITRPIVSKGVAFMVRQAKPVDTMPGSLLTLAFTVHNHQRQPLEQVSIFVRHDQPEFGTHENLVGQIAAGESHAGRLEMQVPSFWPAGPLRLQVGLAIAGRAQPHLQQSLDVMVKSRSTPQLDVTASLSHEKGGRFAGRLEAREQARLKVTVHNQSAIVAHKLQIKVLNLAGKQLAVLQSDDMLPQLKPYQKHVAYFDIAGSEKMVDAQVKLGLLIESQDLKEAFKKQTTLLAVPSKTKENSKPVHLHEVSGKRRGE